MYSYDYDVETGGIILNSSPLQFSKEPRPVYYQELDILGFDKYWNYDKNDLYPYMWAEANNYYYRGRKVAQTKGGSCYTAPELIILEAPEPNNASLQFVDLPAMIIKNQELLEGLVQDTIKKVYNTYIKYKDKVDIFHVSYSGGKDSEVTFDIVQRTLPHNEFVVVFGDTGMEFPDTYVVIEETKKFCIENNISFYTAKSEFDPLDSWKLFGAPSSAMRWCCGVHKTAPQLLKIREIAGKNNVREMAFVGVRSSESIRRRGYDYISFGTKHSGQSSCNPILDWNSAEVYSYIYMQGLIINKAYKKGSSRAGCLYCPMSTLRSDYFNYTLYPKEVQPYIDIIKNLYVEGRATPELFVSYIENKGWNARKNGRDFSNGIGDFEDEMIKNQRIITFKPKGNSWKEWLKTVGYIECTDIEGTIRMKDNFLINFQIKKENNEYLKLIFDEDVAKRYPTIFKNIKNALKKSHSCVACRYCEANCPHGNIHFINGAVKVDDACIKCGLCNNIDNGCLVYNSLILPKGTGTMRKGSIDEYGTHPLKMEWLKDFIKLKEEFETKCVYEKPMVSMFKRFLRDAGITNAKNLFLPLANILFNYGVENEIVWALIFSNLAYAPQVGWLVDNVLFNTNYSQHELKDTLRAFITSKTGPANIANSYKKMSELPISNVGFGRVTFNGKDGFEFVRIPWKNPDPRVILYSLFKFAEACGDYYQFTLSRLFNYDIDSDGVSPTRIFGMDRELMEKILTSLSINYPEFINVSFTHDLDNITLRSDKSTEDVLSLF